MRPKKTDKKSEKKPVDFTVTVRSTEDHPQQDAFVNSKAKRIIIRAGRRGGKTTGIAKRMVKRFLEGRRQLYAAPTSEQLDACWKEVCNALSEPIQAGVFKKNETLHTVELPGTQQRIRAKTAWNADTLRGDYADDLYLDEWQLMNEEAWEVVGAPMLLDNNGDAVFIYTPPSMRSRSTTKARDPLHAPKLYKKAEEFISESLRKGEEPKWAVFHFASWANPYISADAVAEIAGDMSALAMRQEIGAEDIMEVPGALWTRELIEKTRISADKQPVMRRIVVAIDPSVTSKETSDACGLVVCGEGDDGHGYVMLDATKRDTPRGWASRGVALYNEFRADRIVAETNNGGELVEATIRSIEGGDRVSYKSVHASRGKIIRAEPIAARFERGMMHIVGVLPLVEEEMVSYVPGNTSPNALDAMVWGMTELFEHSNMLGVVGYFKEEQERMAQTAKNLIKPAMPTGNGKADCCPECGGVAIVRLANGKKCNNCGSQFGGIKLSLPMQSRKDVMQK